MREREKERERCILHMCIYLHSSYPASPASSPRYMLCYHICTYALSHFMKQFFLKKNRSVCFIIFKKKIKDVARGGPLGELSHEVKFQQDAKL